MAGTISLMQKLRICVLLSKGPSVRAELRASPYWGCCMLPILSTPAPQGRIFPNPISLHEEFHRLHQISKQFFLPSCFHNMKEKEARAGNCQD